MLCEEGLGPVELVPFTGQAHPTEHAPGCKYNVLILSKAVTKAKALDLYESRYKLSVGNGVEDYLLPDPRLRHSLIFHTALRTPIGPYQREQTLAWLALAGRRQPRASLGDSSAVHRPTLA